MSVIQRPMLADTLKEEDIDKLKYPVWCTKKLDGIRCLSLDGEVKSRKLKKIPNTYIRNELNRILNSCLKNSEIFSGEFDGEILSSSKMNFQESTHNIMSFKGEPDFIYYVFDVIDTSLDIPYEDRMKLLEQLEFNDPRIVKLIPTKINNKEELLAYEKECLELGYEGVIGRSGSGPYKNGRATKKESYLWKLKRFIDSEAVITDFEELTENTNESKLNALGLKEKSSNKANYFGKNTLGTLIAKDLYTDTIVRVGSGLDDKLRNEIWNNKEKYMNTVFKYKYFPKGIKLETGKGRHPVFLGFRHQDDMSDD